MQNINSTVKIEEETDSGELSPTSSSSFTNQSKEEILDHLTQTLSSLYRQQEYTSFKALYNSNKKLLNKNIETLTLLISVYKILKEYNTALDHLSTLPLYISNQYKLSLEGLDIHSISNTG